MKGGDSVAQWKPSNAQMSEYNRLLRKHNKMRQAIIDFHRKQEKEHGFGRVPSLVLPTEHKRRTRMQWKITGRQIFNQTMRELRRFANGLGLHDFYKDYKSNLLELIRERIINEPLGAGMNARIKKNWYFSDDQIEAKREDDPDIAELMKVYNRLARLSPEVVVYAYKTGRIPEFKVLYEEFLQGNTVNFYSSWAEEVTNNFKALYNMSRSDALKQMNIDKYAPKQKRKYAPLSHKVRSERGMKRKAGFYRS